jgi:hydroxyquinol 1,2-dioxygenase
MSRSIIQKPGFDTLITHVFVDGGPYLDSDAVFEVSTSCLGDYVRHEAGTAPDGRKLDRPFYTLDARFALAAL